MISNGIAIADTEIICEILTLFLKGRQRNNMEILSRIIEAATSTAMGTGKVMPLAAVEGLADDVMPARQDESSRRPDAHPLADPGHGRPQDAAEAVAVDVDQLDRVADSAELGQDVASFEDRLTQREQARPPVGEVLKHLPREGIIFQVAPARMPGEGLHTIGVRIVR